MEYIDAIAYINDKEKFGSRLGLSSISKLMELLGNPQNDLNIIHVAGTNGKGSTSSYIASCIKTAGYKVGLYTSPYLERFNERIQINGIDIPDESLGEITFMVKEAADKMVKEGMEHPTTFELVTAVGFLYFKKEKVDYLVLEVGLGGRFDSTNVIKKSLASVITSIDFDHISQLGDTLAKIAYQKAGIIKENGIVISYEQEKEVADVIEEVAESNKAELYISKNKNIDTIKESDSGNVFDYRFKEEYLLSVKTSLIGEYQVYNASLAITTLLVLREKGFIKISNQDIYNGILDTKWKGRLEVLKRDPIFLIDGAHNIQGINHLAKALELFTYERLILGIGILKDKDVDHMIERLIPMADIVVATEVKIPRKLEAEELASKIREYNENVYIEKDIKEAIDKAFSLANKEDLILFGGSLYLIGEVRTLVKLL
ncbi:MAG TPA: folylpolyglutamate synthase/dihydrofolate synthase family protein [Tissierellaceae bacterium]|nr:folylpolyglutamate synthase/dihydrofolate synthase family protein [Tissierellaceae bacterium]